MPATSEFVPLARLAAARLAWLAELPGSESDALVAAVAGACESLLREPAGSAGEPAAPAAPAGSAGEPAEPAAWLEVRYLVDDGGVEVRGTTSDGRPPFRLFHRRGPA